MRVIAAVILVLLLVTGGAWLLGLPPFGERAAPVPQLPDLFAFVASGDTASLTQAVAAGGDPNARNAAGLSALMAGITSSAPAELLDALLASGADIDQQTASGMTALMLAAKSGTPAQVVYLLNAGADPTVLDAEGKNAVDHGRTSSAVRTSGAFARLSELAPRPFVRGWPSGYVVPVDGATISSRRNHLPGAPRAYRNGVHEGFDFYDGTVSVSIGYGTPIRAAADGIVMRADHAYVELNEPQYHAVIAEATGSLDTPPQVLDQLRGRQIWLQHAGGFVTRYAHLAAVSEGVIEGSRVRQGDIIGTTGNSGTLEAALGTFDDPHPHVEIWRGSELFLGSGMEPEAIWSLAAQVFGQGAVPPFHD